MDQGPPAIGSVRYTHCPATFHRSATPLRHSFVKRTSEPCAFVERGPSALSDSSVQVHITRPSSLMVSDSSPRSLCMPSIIGGSSTCPVRRPVAGSCLVMRCSHSSAIHTDPSVGSRTMASTSTASCGSHIRVRLLPDSLPLRKSTGSSSSHTTGFQSVTAQ